MTGIKPGATQAPAARYTIMKFIARYNTLLFGAAFCVCLWFGLSGPRSSPTPLSAPSSAADPQVVATLKSLLRSPLPGVRASALEWISRDPRAQSTEFVPLIFAALKDKDGTVRDKALANLGWILNRCNGTPQGAEALAAIKGALRQTQDRAAQQTALELIGGAGQSGVYVNASAGTENRLLVSDPSIRAMVRKMLEDPHSSLRPQLLNLISGSPSLNSDPIMAKAAAAALDDDELSVRNDAIHLLVKMYQQGAAGVRTGAKPLLESALRANDPNVRTQAARALGVPVPPPPAQAQVASLTGGKVAIGNVPFDFNYFTAFVQPLFVKKYGGAACVDCHTPQSNTSGRFRILAPAPDGRYTLEQSRVNFVSVLASIDRSDPMKSRLLLKPLDPTTREGALRGLGHDGGVFWRDQYDPDFEIVADWLKGAKLEDPPQKQLDFAYFARYIEPIFSTRGPDGFACINCHFSHAILHLESPETSKGAFSIEEVVNNYQSALRVVDESAPANSYIVRKPTSPREGVAGGISHAGGVRWPTTKQSWQYKALIAWIGEPNLASGPAKTAALSAGTVAAPIRPH
ncbi:MAG: HEAT repeat domain-containing protein [Terriglobia bacterium]